MTQVNYAEKQFENAANIEFALLGADVFSPGQVAEAILGYDAAVAAPTAASAALIAACLRGPVPAGVPLAPNHWSACSKQPPAGFLPGRWVSFIVQWKRPERLVRPPVPGWAGHEPPFYRFPYRAIQRDVLERLEDALAGLALVRYGAPAIPDVQHLETAQVRRRVLALTHFISPQAGAGHDAWTYKTPHGPGFPNESGPASDGEDFATLVGSALESATLWPEAREHLVALGRRMREYFGDAPLDALDNALDDQFGLQALNALLHVSVVAGAADASWWLADLSDTEAWTAAVS